MRGQFWRSGLRPSLTIASLRSRFAARSIPLAAASLSIVVLTFAPGCALRPPYREPEVKPAALRQADQAFFANQPYDPAWWKEFDDPVLAELIGAVLKANLDVRAAVARLDQSRAFFDEVRRDQYPTVTVGASIDKREQAAPGLTDEPVNTTTYRAGFDAFWEIDLFGRIRSAVRAASANAQALESALEDVRVSVASEAARNYFELRGIQQQLAVTERSLENARETLRLSEVRRDAGIGEEQDVASARARVAGVESSLPPLRAALAEREHRLAVLSGTRPGELAVNLAPRPYPTLAKALPLGDPTTLLRNRPDVRAAERRLAAATAQESVAAADLFPRVTVSGVLGFLAGRGSLFGKSDSRQWAVTPSLSWAAFDLGSARARLRGTEAVTRETLAIYEQTVLRALEETENALVAYREQQRRLVSLVDQARESGRAASIARVRYKEGLVDFLQLLDAERTELQSQEAVAQAEAGVFTGVVGIYKSLGGIPR
jgi:multidrug efflux system outer membrane protein